MTVIEKIRQSLGNPALSDEYLISLIIDPEYVVMRNYRGNYRRVNWYDKWNSTMKLDYNAISDLSQSREYW